MHSHKDCPALNSSPIATPNAVVAESGLVWNKLTLSPHWLTMRKEWRKPPLVRRHTFFKLKLELFSYFYSMVYKNYIMWGRRFCITVGFLLRGCYQMQLELFCLIQNSAVCILLFKSNLTTISKVLIFLPFAFFL